MSPSLLALLRSVDTPTVCNAVEVVQGRRGFSGFTRGTMVASHPIGSPLVGYAITARIAAAAPSHEPTATLRARRMAYYRMMAEGPRPGLAVIEDTDGDDAVGAFWGEVNTTIHKAFGLSGALTDGVVRDLGDLPDDFPVIAGSIGPSHAHVRVTEIGRPVKIRGMDVQPGQLLHADRHGAVAIPTEAVKGLADAIARLRETERLVLGPARSPGFDFAAFEVAWSAFEKART